MAKAKTTKTDSAILPCHDHQRSTCLQVERSGDQVKFIPLDVSEGLEVHTTSADSFDQRFKPMDGYPAEKACRLYLGYSQTIGATKEALGYLGQIINVSKQEFDMATTKKSAAAAAKSATTKAPAKAAAKSTKAAPAKTKAPAKAPAAKGEKRESAAQMFQDLIMAGKLTDDQIFAKVQEKFGLDEKKRGYVKWYRNHLKKQGMNPPEAKVAK